MRGDASNVRCAPDGGGGRAVRVASALKEKAVVLGARCPKCHQVYAPAYCELVPNPTCRLEKVELIELPDVGVITAAEPVITLFAPARRAGKAPSPMGGGI